EEAFRAHRNGLAAAIVEPVVGNMGCVAPRLGFLEKLRALTEEQGTGLIFDEVMTGFRVAYGGAQHIYKIDPDMTTLGKIIGGGLPVGAYGGKTRLMNLVAPVGPVYQAGTLSGNPLAVAAGLKTLEILRRPGLYERLDSLTEKLASGLATEAARAGISLTVNRVGQCSQHSSPPNRLAITPARNGPTRRPTVSSSDSWWRVAYISLPRSLRRHSCRPVTARVTWQQRSKPQA